MTTKKFFLEQKIKEIETESITETIMVVFDRIEGEFAVLTKPDGKNINVLKNKLSQKIKEGTHLNITLHNEELVGYKVYCKATRNTAKRITELISELEVK